AVAVPGGGAARGVNGGVGCPAGAGNVNADAQLSLSHGREVVAVDRQGDGVAGDGASDHAGDGNRTARFRGIDDVVSGDVGGKCDGRGRCCGVNSDGVAACTAGVAGRIGVAAGRDRDCTTAFITSIGGKGRGPDQWV